MSKHLPESTVANGHDMEWHFFALREHTKGCELCLGEITLLAVAAVTMGEPAMPPCLCDEGAWLLHLLMGSLAVNEALAH